MAHTVTASQLFLNRYCCEMDCWLKKRINVHCHWQEVEFCRCGHVSSTPVGHVCHLRRKQYQIWYADLMWFFCDGGIGIYCSFSVSRHYLLCSTARVGHNQRHRMRVLSGAKGKVLGWPCPLRYFLLDGYKYQRVLFRKIHWKALDVGVGFSGSSWFTDLEAGGVC